VILAGYGGAISFESEIADSASNYVGVMNRGLFPLWESPEMHKFLYNGRGPVYSVRPTPFSGNDYNSEASRFDDNSPTG
jgi:hypothetical protein